MIQLDVVDDDVQARINEQLVVVIDDLERQLEELLVRVEALETP